MKNGRVAMEYTLAGFLLAGVSSLDVFFREPGAERICVMGDGEGRVASYCSSCGAFFVAPRDTPDPNDRSCGQCGISLRPGRTGCHFCGWQPSPAEDSIPPNRNA